MTDGFVQHHAGPAGAQHDVHFARRGGHRLEINQRLADGAIGGFAPCLGVDEAGITFAAAIALAAAFLTITLAGNHRNVDAHQGTDIAVTFAIRPQDFDHLPGRAQADRDLPHPRILVADVSVNFGEQFYLYSKPGASSGLSSPYSRTLVCAGAAAKVPL